MDQSPRSKKICLNRSNLTASSVGNNSPSLKLYPKRLFIFSLVISLNLKIFIISENWSLLTLDLFIVAIFQKIKLNNSEECKVCPFCLIRLAAVHSWINLNICSYVYLYWVVRGKLLRYPKWGWTSLIMTMGSNGKSTLYTCEYSYPNLTKRFKANLSSFLYFAVRMA